MKVSDNGKLFITQQEGLRLKVYLDSAGLPTVGVGHLILPEDNLHLGDEITYDEAMDFLDADLVKVENCMDKYLKVGLSQNAYDACCSLTFNIGVVAFKNSTLLKKINSYDLKGAASQFLVWDKITDPVSGKKVPLSSISKRRERESKLFETPDA